MSTEASILTESAEDALYVPVEAVHTSGDQKYVVLADGEKDSDAAESNAGRATSRIEVETGIYNDTYVEITSGLEAGQKVQLPTIERSKGDTKESSEMGDGMRLGDGPEGGQGPGNGNQGPGMMPGGNNGSGMGGSSQGPGRGGE
ncbi:hypothetical protein RWE15_05760 [Virgibacillus halophilus]|uniref:HlyD family secretion protein n=2 Tax=Tigheibacillus halophilus TaxID=361280 RepID=A0ABU5C685_9BACI|nr:hypothetical protein [Virgibacillus halophilus]